MVSLCLLKPDLEATNLALSNPTTHDELLLTWPLWTFVPKYSMGVNPVAEPSVPIHDPNSNGVISNCGEGQS